MMSILLAITSCTVVSANELKAMTVFNIYAMGNEY